MSVYFVQDGHGNVKIGHTNYPDQRVAAMQPSNATKLQMIRVVDGCVYMEGWMHRRFSHARLIGEWFSFDPDMLTVEPPDNPRAIMGKKRWMMTKEAKVTGLPVADERAWL